MSFLSVFKKILNVTEKATEIIAPYEKYVELVPGFGTTFGTVFNTVVALEHLIPQDGAGPQKKPLALSIIKTAAPELNQDKVSQAIDQFISALKLLQDAQNEQAAAVGAK